MSIQSYLQTISYDDRVRTAEQELPALTKTGRAMEFQVNIMVTRGFDKTAMKSSTFTIVGENATVEGLIEAGSILASNIARLSKGVISGFYAKLGKYRPDVVPQDVAPGDNSYCVLTMTNNENNEYSYYNCTNIGREYPSRTVTNNFYVPWIRNDVSDADVIATFKDFEVELDGVTYTTGYVRFNSDEKIGMTCYPVKFVKYIDQKKVSRSNPAFLNNNDVELGIVNDDILSEKFSTVKSAGDDFTNTPEG